MKLVVIICQCPDLTEFHSNEDKIDACFDLTFTETVSSNIEVIGQSAKTWKWMEG